MPFIPISDNVKATKVTDEPKFGTVVDNNDPLKIGRVKVEIQGIFEGTPESLPWVRRKTDTIFCGSDCEIFDVPEVGSVVEVRWSYDDNTPTYSGAPYSQRHQTSAFSENYPYEAGIKFGPHVIKFNKACNLLTIENSKVQIVLDGMGECSVACSDMVLNVKRNLKIQAQNVHIGGDLTVDGQFYSTKAAAGVLSPLSIAVIDGGVVKSCEVPNG